MFLLIFWWRLVLSALLSMICIPVYWLLFFAGYNLLGFLPYCLLFVLIDCHFLLVTTCFPCRTARVRPCWWGRPTSPWNAGDSSTPWGWMWPSWSARSYFGGSTSRWPRRSGTTWRWRGSSSSDLVSPQRWLTTHCFVQMFNLITAVKQLVIHCWKGYCVVMLSLLKYVYKEQHRDMVTISAENFLILNFAFIMSIMLS